MALDNYKYNLKSLKKCNQYWDEMNPIIGGRLCAKCDKNIVDFSEMTFSEIAVFMSESNEPVCGFYLPEQLKAIQSFNSKFPIAVGLGTLLATTTFAENGIQQKEQMETFVNNQPINKSILINQVFEKGINIDTFYISGRIEYFDTTTNKNLPVEFASVIVKGTSYGVTTDKMGHFKLRYQTADTGVISIRITSVGLMTYEITDIELKEKTDMELGTIKMEKWKGQVIEFYVSSKNRSKLSRFWRKITKPFRR
jgi:hypothetical protein